MLLGLVCTTPPSPETAVSRAAILEIMPFILAFMVFISDITVDKSVLPKLGVAKLFTLAVIPAILVLI